MAHVTDNTHIHTSFLQVLKAPFAAIFNAMVMVGEASSRSQETQFLYSLSDEDLAARGLKREDIVRHVFRNYMHL